MRRRDSSEKPSESIPLKESIFDEELIRGMAADTSSISEVRRTLGISQPEIISPTQPSIGAHVELGARALAVHELMENINRRNQTNGAHIAAMYGNSDFNRHQKSPEDALSSMRYNGSLRSEAAQKSLDTLNASAAMIAAGFSPETVQETRNRIEDNIKKFEGVGKENIAKRKELSLKLQFIAIRQNISVK